MIKLPKLREGGQDRHRKLTADAQGCSLHGEEVHENGNTGKAASQRGKASSAMGENEMEH